MIGKNGNFFTAHYDWIAAGVACVVLAGGAFLLVRSLGIDPAALAAERAREVRAMSPGGESVKPADLAEFARAAKFAKNPVTVSEIADATASFLASEARMLCTNDACRAAVLRDVRACPVCGVILETVRPEDKDADGDGLPDDWEKKYFRAIAACDPEADADGDGFTNAEEFELKTNPSDKSDHADYLDYLKIQLPLKETKLPFYFVGTMKTPAGLKFQFKDPSRAKEYDRGNYSLLAGQEIGKSGFAPEKFTEKTAERQMGGGMKKKVDVSEALIVRKSDGKRVPLVIGKRGVPVDIQATLAYQRDGGKSFTVVPGDTIELSGVKYTVKEIKRVAKGATVSIEQTGSGKIRLLSALES